VRNHQRGNQSVGSVKPKTSGYARGLATISIHTCPCGRQAVAWRWGYVCADCYRIESELMKPESAPRRPVEWSNNTYEVNIQ